MRGVPRARRPISCGAGGVDADAELVGRAAHDLGELGGAVVVEAQDDAEAREERRRQEAGARGGGDEREARQLDRQHLGVGPVTDGDLEPIVLHRRVQVLLDDGLQAVDLVDEEDAALRQRREVRRERALVLDGGSADGAQGDVERVGDEVRQRRLADAGRAREEHVVERLAATLSGGHEDLQVVDDLGLPDVLVEAARAQRRVVLAERGVDEPRACRRAGGDGRDGARLVRLVGRPRRASCACRAPVVDLARPSAAGATLLYSARMRSAAFTSSATPAPGCALDGVGGGALGLGRLVAEVDQRRGHRLRAAQRALAATPTTPRRTCRAARAPCARPSSCRCRGSCVRRAWSPSRTAEASAPASIVDRIDIASLGPMPCTPVTRWNAARSSTVAKPTSDNESSRTMSSVCTVATLPDGRQRGQRVQRDGHAVADAVDVDEHVVDALVGEGAAQHGDHRRRARRVVARKAWQMATASASEASRRGARLRPHSASTIACT